MLLQNIQNVPFLHIIRILLMMKQNAIFMQDEDKFGTEELKGFKLEKVFIYIRKSTYKLKS